MIRGWRWCGRAPRPAQPIPWVQIHRVPDFVYFNHSVHVNRGISCVECHGQINKMDEVYEVKPLSMTFCLDCHRHPAAKLRPLDKITDLNWKWSDNPTANAELQRQERREIHARLARAVAAKLLRLPPMNPAGSPPRQTRDAGQTGPRYWRSLDELADTPEFRQWVENEFPGGGHGAGRPGHRRHFMKIMSASFLLAGFGLTGCRRPVSNILPFSKQPEGYLHGVPQYYATAMPTRGGAIPLVVKSNEGRPTKVEGNALHPDSNGSTDRFAQASVLDLYDPDRATHFKQAGKVVTQPAALDFLSGLSRRVRGQERRGPLLPAGAQRVAVARAAAEAGRRALPQGQVVRL